VPRPVRSAATDAKGAFALESVPFGEYRAVYGVLGTDGTETALITIDAAHRSVDLGQLVIGGGTVKMEKFEVNTRREAFSNSSRPQGLQRRKDIQSATGSASGLFARMSRPWQVDIEGNVSLRGNDNVLILINGKPSTQMNAANRGWRSSRWNADSVEKIEVITNPSANTNPTAPPVSSHRSEEKARTGYSRPSARTSATTIATTVGSMQLQPGQV